jgi:hypothetical protein
MIQQNTTNVKAKFPGLLKPITAYKGKEEGVRRKVSLTP